MSRCVKGKIERHPRTGRDTLRCAVHGVWSPSGRLCDICNADPQFWAKRGKRRDLRNCKPCKEKMMQSMQRLDPDPLGSVTRGCEGVKPPPPAPGGRHALEAYRNIHKGQRGFIMATGPSVAQQDITWLRNEIVLGVNFAHKITRKKSGLNLVPWIPRYMVTADHRVLGKLKDEWEKLETKVVVTDTCMMPTKCGYKAKNLVSGTGVSLKYRSDIFTWDCTRLIHIHRASSTVGHLAIPFAAFLGLNPIYLIGCDCTARGHAYDDKGVVCPRAMHLWTTGFMPAMKTAHDALAKAGVQLRNATLGGNLKSIPRVDYDSLRRL